VIVTSARSSCRFGKALAMGMWSHLFEKLKPSRMIGDIASDPSGFLNNQWKFRDFP
jgi:hypothetical protein